MSPCGKARDCSFNAADLCHCHYVSNLIYNAAMATKIAPIAPTKEPDRTLAALVEMTGLVEVLEPVWVAVARVEEPDLVPTGTVLLLPDTPVAEEVEPEAVAVAEAPMPLPAPSDGERPEPEETTPPELAAETRDEPALAAEDEAAAAELELPLPLPPATAVELEDDALVEVWLLAELEAEEISLQDKS